MTRGTIKMTSRSPAVRTIHEVAMEAGDDPSNSVAVFGCTDIDGNPLELRVHADQLQTLVDQAVHAQLALGRHPLSPCNRNLLRPDPNTAPVGDSKRDSNHR